MDSSRFDDLARLLGSAAGRRPVLRALLGAALGAAVSVVSETAARTRKRGKDRDRDRDEDQGRGQDRDKGQNRLQAEGRGKKRRKKKKKRGGSGGGQTEPPPPECCGTEACPDPDPGSTSAGCDFAGRFFAGQDFNGSIFRGIDGRGTDFTAADLHGSVFAEACLQGASFRSARLDGSTWGGACLFDADFTGADLGGDLTLFDDALFCDTTMPDGAVNDRDCGRETACCRAELGGNPACQRDADCPPNDGLRCVGGQCVCDGQSCPNGCCLSASGASLCLDGEGDAFCGSGGAACVDCGGGAQCFAKVCICRPGQCDGCCENGPNNPGRCLANTPPVCGVDGAQCTSCPTGDGRTCNGQGQCVCTPQSCPNGCCDEDGNCQPGNTSQDCGTGGQTCARCAAGQGCQNGVCACTPQSCPNGCCAADGTCQPGDAFQACGTGGNACAGCNDSQTCQDQQCVNCGNSTCICTGQSLCTDDGASNLECSGPSDPNACFCYVSQTGRPFCGGTVTISEPNGCSSDADCGAGGACLVNTDSGPCAANGKPFCVSPCCQPNCAGSVCGPDGCGGNCGGCPGELVCNASGQCVSTCTPQTCPNGCCAADGSCQPGTAKGACGKGGATCQACGAGEGCLGQQCEPCFARTCAEAGVQCGPTTDGCGAPLQCGSCSLQGDAPSCQNGDCVACDDACPANCTACFQAPDGTTICGSNLVVGCPLPCSSDADCGNDDFPTCLASGVERDSGEAQTFADFCQTPGVVGVCVAVVPCCQPDCAGKVCGDDGCGGSCGSCSQCQECQSGTCQTTGMVCGNICCALTNEFCCTDAGPYCCEDSFVACCQGTCCS